VKSRYRLVHFHTHPVGGTRVPIGAVIESDGRVEAVAVPSPSVPGDAAVRAAAAVSGSLLRTITRFDLLPPVFSPQVTLEEPRAIPAGVLDPASWVRSFILQVPAA